METQQKRFKDSFKERGENNFEAYKKRLINLVSAKQNILSIIRNKAREDALLKLNENFNNYDVYFNISGGIKTQDVGIDFAVAAALFSSKNKKPIKNNNVFIGELSLTGKIKNIYKSDIRTKEAIKFNCNKIYSPVLNKYSFKNFFS